MFLKLCLIIVEILHRVVHILIAVRLILSPQIQTLKQDLGK